MASAQYLEPEDQNDLEVQDDGDILNEITAAVGRKVLSGGKSGTRLAIRLQPTIWDPEKGQYRGWRGVSHVVTVKDAAAAERFRGMLANLFDTLKAVGMNEVEAALAAAREKGKT